MKEKSVKIMKIAIRPLLFILAGALIGVAYYTFFGCAGSCPITSNFGMTVLYGSVLGFLISVITKKGEK